MKLGWKWLTVTNNLKYCTFTRKFYNKDGKVNEQFPQKHKTRMEISGCGKCTILQHTSI